MKKTSMFVVVGPIIGLLYIILLPVIGLIALFAIGIHDLVKSPRAWSSAPPDSKMVTTRNSHVNTVIHSR